MERWKVAWQYISEWLWKCVVGEHDHLWGHEPLVVRQGGDHVAQRAEAMRQQDDDDSGGFYPGSGPLYGGNTLLPA